MVQFSPESPPQSPQQHRRVLRSCQECRRSKAKCNRNEPCSHCILTRSACIYSIRSVRAKATGGRISRAASSRAAAAIPTTVLTPPTAALPSGSRPLQLSTANNNIESSFETIQQVAPPSAQVPLFQPIESTAHDKNRELADLRNRLQKLEKRLVQHDDHVTVEPSTWREQNTIDLTNVISPNPPLGLNKSRLFGQSHWSSTAALEFRKITGILGSGTVVAGDAQDTTQLMLEIRSLLSKYKLLATARKSFERQTFPTTSTLGLSTKSLADQMTQLYLSHFESAFRVLHIPSFMKEYETYWQDPLARDNTTELKIGLVVAIGASLCRDTATGSTDLTQSHLYQYVHAAQQWSALPIKKDQLSIVGLQIQCLLILAREVLAIGADLVYLTLGTILRTAMQMGVHQDAKHFKRMSILEGEVRRRLWVTILELNLQASMDAGVPPHFSLDECDSQPPLNLNDIDLDETGTLRQHPLGTTTETSLQRRLFETLPFRYRVIKRMNSINHPISYDEISIFTKEIQNTCRDLKRVVKGNADEAVFRHNLADLLLRRILFCLHRPFASQASTTSSVYFSRKVCLDTALTSLSPPPNQEFSNLISGGGGIFKSRMLHISLSLASELLIELAEAGAMSEPRGYRRVLVDAIKEALGQAGDRIRFGETNADVKIHMKLSMALCQACTHVEVSDEPLLVQLAQSAKSSLETSCAILQGRVHDGTIDDYSLTDHDSVLPDFSFDTGFGFDDLFGPLDVNDCLTTEQVLLI